MSHIDFYTPILVQLTLFPRAVLNFLGIQVPAYCFANEKPALPSLALRIFNELEMCLCAVVYVPW